MSRNRNRNRGRRGGNNDNRKRGHPGILINRRNPGFGWVSPLDIWYNIKERFYCWWWRVPEGSYIAWNKNGKIRGHSTRAKRPYFR